MSPSLRAYLPWAIVGVLLLGCCASVPVVAGVWWLAGRHSTDGAVAPGKAAAKADTANWGWQDLQDHLEKKGLMTGRAAVGDGTMMFEAYDGPGKRRDEFNFSARDLGSPEGAKKCAHDLKDVHQTDVLAWGRFVFLGSPASLNNLKKLLP